MRVLCALLKYDYGIKERGASLEFSAFYPAIQSAVQEVIPFWLEEHGFSDDLDKLQSNLLEKAKEIKPDLVLFCLMRDEIRMETITLLNQFTQTTNWFCDDRWRFHNYSRYLAENLSYCITTDRYSVASYKQLGFGDKVILSQWATNELISQDAFVKREQKYNVTFIGGYHPYRGYVVKELSKRGINVECFGTGWANGRISFERMAEVNLTSRISLNLSNSISPDIKYVLSSIKALKDYLNSKKRVLELKARNFEIIGGGGFLLTFYSVGLEHYFDIGRELAIYTSIDDLALQINYFLTNGEERERIRTLGFSRVQQHTYNDRFRAIFEEIEKK
jgi:spore maturation protein CgeB